MAVSRHAKNVSDSPLTKLLEVDSSLSEQETQLQVQLKEIQEKRKSLESVISIFSSTDTSATVSASSAVKPIAQPETNGKSPSTVPSVSVEPKAKVESKTKTAKKTSKTAAKTKPTGKSATNQPAAKKPEKVAKTKKSDSSKGTRRSQDWQQYVRQEFSEASLPEAVNNFLRSQPDEVVGIPEVIDAIFLDEMPKQVRSKASNRISNILSTGLKDNKWYRGRTGHYSVSQSAAIADLSA